MSKLLTRKQILKKSRKPLLIRSKVYGNLKLRGFLSFYDISNISKDIAQKLTDKEFTISVINAHIIKSDKDIHEIEAWDDKRIIYIARKLAEKIFANRLEEKKIESYSDFKSIAVEHVEDFNKKMTASMKGLSESVSQMMNFQIQISHSLDAIAKNIAFDMQSVTNSLASVLSNTVKSFDVSEVIRSATFEFLPNIDDLFSFIYKSTREEEAILNLLGESEYEFAIDILENRFSRNLLNIKPTQRKTVITKKLVQITSSNEFNKDLEKIFEMPYLKPRWAALNQALSAHRSRQYFLSVPVFLAQAEGIFTDLLILKKIAYKKDKNIYALTNGSPKKNRKGKLLRLDTLNQKINHAKGHFEEEKYIEITVDTIVGRFVKVRNGVFHGKVSNYGISTNSTKALLLVFTLANLLEREVNNPSGQSSTEYIDGG